MPSVAARIVLALQQRLLCIRGQGSYTHDLQGRVHLRRFTGDAQSDDLPAVYIARRVGGGEATTARPVPPHYDTTVTFDVVGVVKRSPNVTLAGEALLADIQRALERGDDLFLADAETGRNLLAQELAITSVETLDTDPVLDAVAVGVTCTWPHTYGDPDHVA
jgi:hypothetical protein